MIANSNSEVRSTDRQKGWMHYNSALHSSNIYNNKKQTRKKERSKQTQNKTVIKDKESPRFPLED